MRQRHGIRHLLWRGMIASIGNAATFTGFYPVVPHLGMLAGRRARRRASPPGQLRAMSTEWAVASAFALARPLGFLGVPAALRRRQGPRPIIVVHGYAMNRANFVPLAYRLARADLGPVYGFEYWTLGKTASAAHKLGRYVDALCEHAGADRVDLIGHSMGGLVARYYVQLAGGGPRVANLITLGSPHGGTDLSALGIGRPTKELLTGSALVQRLDAAPLPADTRITVIWSRSDAMVPAVRGAHLPGVDEIVYDDLGHMSLLVSPRVAREIITRLAATAPRP